MPLIASVESSFEDF